jgi:hypothetical protein
MSRLHRIGALCGEHDRARKKLRGDEDQEGKKGAHGISG